MEQQHLSSRQEDRWPGPSWDPLDPVQEVGESRMMDKLSSLLVKERYRRSECVKERYHRSECVKERYRRSECVKERYRRSECVKERYRRSECVKERYRRF